jgi:hypothetical protein
MTENLAVVSTDIRLLNVRTRLPFEFGIVTMTEVPHCFVTVEFDVDETTRGRAADHFPPRWLTKDPSRSLEEENRTILRVVERACELAEGIEGDSVFVCWRRLFEAQRMWARTTNYQPLLWNFVVALVERAMIDAFCRATRRTFPEAVDENALGTRPGYVYPELEGRTPAEFLPDEPVKEMGVRHTVGHDDPLRTTDESGPDDGLPVTLVENVSAYGIDRFKIKLTGDVEADHDRLREVLSLLDNVCDDYAYTLDANEQYRTPGDLAALLDRLQSDSAVETPDERLLFVEQPFPREESLSPHISEALAD